MMNPTYRIVGADGNVYGPVSFDDIQHWIQEGRIGPQTQIHRSDGANWQPATAFSELGLAATNPIEPQPGPSVPTPLPVPPSSSIGTLGPSPAPHPALAPLAIQIKASAGWFYWIAGLSLINSLAALFQGGFGFVMGLGITQVLDAFVQQSGSGARAVALTLNITALAIFVAFGLLANRRHTWAFALGLALYLADGMIFVLTRQWFPFGFHILAAFFIFKGLQACRFYHKLDSQTHLDSRA
jgi:hypothetical protein